jgi:hypothetical protein
VKRSTAAPARQEGEPTRRLLASAEGSPGSSGPSPAIVDALAKLAAADPALRAVAASVLNAVLDCAPVGGEASAFPGVSDSRIVDEPDGASPKGKPMHRVHGQYPHHDKWLIKIVDRATRKVTNRIFETHEEAERAAKSLKRSSAGKSGSASGRRWRATRAGCSRWGTRGRGTSPGPS